ncbi:MAG: sortase [Chloroflexi bacterium]|nr:sortase [Chloroflexota bacterium]
MKSVRKYFFHALTLALLLSLQAAPARAAATINTVDTGVGGQWTSLVLNASGFPVISYYDDNDRDLKVAVCGDETCSAGNITTTVDGTGGVDVGQYSSIKLNASGFPVISYWDETNTDLKVVVCGNASCSAGNTITTVDSAGDVGEYTSLELNASGFPVISYYDSTNTDPKVAICTNAICGTKTIVSLDGTVAAGLYTSLELNSSGFPVVSYIASGNLKLAYCSNFNCTLGGVVTLDAAGAYSTSLELSSSGVPIISYQGSSTTMKVASCGNATCSSGNTTTAIDSTSFPGNMYSSIALDASGIPFISYYDVGNSDLKIAACGNTTCSAGNGVSTVDSAGNVGSYTSIAINANGFPVVSYAGSGSLKYAGVTSPVMAGYTLQPNYPSGPTSFTVTFGEDVNNPSGDSGADDVTNPNNYKIIELGPNGVIDTASCAVALGGDDILITPSSVTYIPNTALINLSSALPGGSYRLFVCGTTSITSLLHFPINDGADYTIDFTVAASGTTITTKTEKTEASSLPKTGFAPNKITTLPVQPATLEYAELGDLWLEIPSLNVKSTIVGVPQNKDKTWDVTWLGNDTGWLNGTAFPTWNGNSVLTAHVTNASGLDGPFAALKSLKYGDQVIVHFGGVKYVYEVRNTRLARPYSTSFAFESKQDAAYLTLITCSGYNPLNETYLFRRVVRAVLVSVVNE